MDPDKKYHPNKKWHLKNGSKATYVEYWYPYDVKNKKAMTWEEYRKDMENGRNEKEFTLATRYTAVFNAHEVEGMPELQWNSIRRLRWMNWCRNYPKEWVWKS